MVKEIEIIEAMISFATIANLANTIDKNTSDGVLAQCILETALSEIRRLSPLMGGYMPGNLKASLIP
jgi:hypothetical protein